MRVFLVAALLTAATGCSRDRKNPDGLPPASEWKQDQSGAMVQMGQPKQPEAPTPPPGMAPRGNPPSMGAPNDPHAGLGIDPTNPSDPHAGLDMTGAMGGGGGVDVAQMGLPPPDPSRPIDPSRYVKGVIKIHEKAKGRAKVGTSIFIVVKRADASGNPVGTPLAVDKLTWGTADLSFELTEAQAMVGGTELTGDVVVTARYDQDSDALSKEAGDITGQVRVKLPADNVQLWLDTVL